MITIKFDDGRSIVIESSLPAVGELLPCVDGYNEVVAISGDVVTTRFVSQRRIGASPRIVFFDPPADAA